MLIARLNKGGIGEVGINGLLSGLIKLTRGTGQGDPASTGKFLLLHSLWMAVTQHAIETSKEELHQLMIPYESVINQLITQDKKEELS